ncbi:MAG: glycosyltransferase [Acidimicrobiales bacterium]|jgi:hypothetical protein
MADAEEADVEEADVEEADVEEADVAGMNLDPALAEPRTSRSLVAIVVAGWGLDWGERRMAIRLVAGAIALNADVVVVSLDDRSHSDNLPPWRRWDGIFPIHSSTARPPSPRLGQVLRASLARQPGSPSSRASLSETIASQLLATDAQPSSEALGILDHLKPDVVVLAGVETLWMAVALPLGASRPRVIVLPLLGNDAALSSDAMKPLSEIVDAVGAFSVAEHRLLSESVGSRHPEILHRLRLSFPVNRQAAHSGLAGVASFGRYLLVISGWPDEPQSGVGPPHDYLRAVLGDISVAEVRRGQWLVTEHGRHFDVPWSSTRMNLWRLMAGAVVTIDVRPPGPIGREAIESLLFGTPVVVPAGSVAAEHAKASNGGLWYSAPGEMIAAARHLVDNETEREAFGRAGREWAEREHDDTERLVDDLTRIVLG